MLFMDLKSDVQRDIFNISGTSARSLAENSAGGMLTNSDPLGLYENAALGRVS